jgi:hypothetical protein
MHAVDDHATDGSKANGLFVAAALVYRDLFLITPERIIDSAAALHTRGLLRPDLGFALCGP